MQLAMTKKRPVPQGGIHSYHHHWSLADFPLPPLHETKRNVSLLARKAMTGSHEKVLTLSHETAMTLSHETDFDWIARIGYDSSHETDSDCIARMIHDSSHEKLLTLSHETAKAMTRTKKQGFSLDAMVL